MTVLGGLSLVTFQNPESHRENKQFFHLLQIKSPKFTQTTWFVPSWGTVGNPGFQVYLPKEILSDVASLFSQNDTQDMTTKIGRAHV